jgi:hypothetical protein
MDSLGWNQGISRDDFPWVVPEQKIVLNAKIKWMCAYINEKTY